MEKLPRRDSQEFKSISKRSSRRKARGAIASVGEVYRDHRLNLSPSLRLCRCLYVLVHCAEISLILTSSCFDASGMNLSDLANIGPCMTNGSECPAIITAEFGERRRIAQLSCRGG
jgi:hypothetical protein